MTKRNWKLDRQIEAIVNRRCRGLAINILEIGNVYQAGYNAAFNGDDVEAAVYETYCRLAREAATV